MLLKFSKFCISTLYFVLVMADLLENAVKVDILKQIFGRNRPEKKKKNNVVRQ